jgi:putative flippase GtrA
VRTTLRQLVRFGVVGIAATAVHAALLLMLVELAALGPMPATALAFSAAVMVTFMGQSFLVFQNISMAPRRILKFLATALGGLIGNVAIMGLFAEILRLHYLIGLGVALTVVPTATFLLSRFWVFRRDSRVT